MEPFIERLRNLLQTEFAGSQDELESRPARKVGGFLIWDGFSGHEQIQRQQRVWNVLRQRLNPDDQQRITAILTVTPTEWSAMTGSPAKVQTGLAFEQYKLATGDNNA
jgi:acid stress-induced BolA-like protein IbaG/YrbA